MCSLSRFVTQFGMAPSTSTEAHAAYGLRWGGVADEALSVRDCSDWPLISIEQRLTDNLGGSEQEVSPDCASIRTLTARLELDRANSSIQMRSVEPVPVSDVIHPALWPAAAVFARWHGRETFHAGAISFDGTNAWGILGDRGAGKSSLLAALALEGVAVLADDLVVVAGQRCFAGPRCIDLRPDAAAALGITADTSLVRSTQRRRMSLPPCDGEYLLSGFIELRWGNDVWSDHLMPAEGFPLLVDHRRVAALGADFEHLLDLVALPAVRLSRPREWRSPERLVAELRRLVDPDKPPRTRRHLVAHR